MTKQAILVRHGRYDPQSLHLSEDGEADMENAALQIKQQFNIHGKTAVLAAYSPRTKEGGEIFARVLGSGKHLPVKELKTIGEKSFGGIEIIKELKDLSKDEDMADADTAVILVHSAQLKGTVPIMIAGDRLDEVNYGTGEGAAVTYEVDDWSQVDIFTGDKLEFVRAH